jgi:hypothetical protein
MNKVCIKCVAAASVSLLQRGKIKKGITVKKQTIIGKRPKDMLRRQ